MNFLQLLRPGGGIVFFLGGCVFFLGGGVFSGSIMEQFLTVCENYWSRMLLRLPFFLLCEKKRLGIFTVVPQSTV